ncbi:MAG: class I SAM-dependent methyltransferase [Lentisphaerae bacterium]|nr:class I SAM-dependent methyltransferase [Lentisphaerota bacterium]
MLVMARYETFNPYVFQRIGDAATVLDVGCATGMLGSKLRQAGHSGRLVGIEKDPAMAQIADPFYDELIVTDLEHVEKLPLDHAYFDVIVCADILEHLRDPAAALNKLVPHLKRDGKLVVSVPNIAFAGIRLSLLAGRFSYEPNGGILDATHLRFFTRASLRVLLEDVGLRVTLLTGYNLVRRRYAFLKLLGRLFPTLFCIQFLSEAQRP